MTDIILQPPHAGQLAAWNKRGRFTALRCGRRWGKTELLIKIGSQASVQGEYIGVFAPDYKILSETYRAFEDTLRPVTATSSKTDGLIRLTTGGRLDFWTLNNPRAGRSRKYHKVLVDEAAFAGEGMTDIWDKAIKPSLLDFKGEAWAMSTPAGRDERNWFYSICNSDEWTEFHAPTSTNPFLPTDEIQRLAETNAPDVFRQEYLAEFVDWDGIAFFGREHLLEDGQPLAIPERTDVVFCTIDTAIKTGKDNDATGCIFWSWNSLVSPGLHILDWDYIQIEGALLEEWLPTVFQRLEGYAKQCGARYGSAGAFIEDKASGMVLLQQAARRNWPARSIDSKLTSVGKDERAISVSGYHYQGLCKITQPAFDKIVTTKGRSANHLLSQVCGYRVGQKDAEDDLLDCYTYGLALACGNSGGF